MRHAVSVVGGFALSLFIASMDAWSSEETIPLDQLPKAVSAAVKKRFPKLEMTEAAKEETDGKTVYEVTVKENGKNIDVTLTPEGVITTIEKEIAAKDLPKAVSDGVEKKYPKATYKIVESVTTVTDGKDKIAYYEVLIVTADKKRMEVEINLDGTIKHEEEKTDEN
jgi:hypothetical protein